MAFASEPKNLVGAVSMRSSPSRRDTATGRTASSSATPTPTARRSSSPSVDERHRSAPGMRERLIAGVEKRLDADAPVGFLLSAAGWTPRWCAPSPGANWVNHPIRTFAIGMDVDAIDLKYAREVAEVHRKRPHRGHHLREEDVHRRAARAGGRSCWAPTTSPPSAPASACIWSASTIHETHRRARAAHRRDLRRAVRLQVHRLRPERRRVPARGGRSACDELHMYDVLRADRCISVQLPGGARARLAIWSSSATP